MQKRVFRRFLILQILEAMQCNIPVITSNTSSLPEVVGDAEILLNPNDVDSLVNAFIVF
ncbi:MAG: glycosyltransferase [Planctomycetaceae bacterium]|nr:glycosyltransferase [Planctomycetaceae bacterium]